jgi:hypothetical protein
MDFLPLFLRFRTVAPGSVKLPAPGLGGFPHRLSLIMAISNRNALEFFKPALEDKLR